MDASNVNWIGRPHRQTLCLALSVGWRRLVRTPLSTFWTSLQLWSWGAEVEGRPMVCGLIRMHVSGQLRFGRGVRMNSGSSNYVGGERRMAIWVGRDATVLIDDHCRLSNSTIVALERIEILSGTFLGGGCNIYDSDFHHLDPERRLSDAPGKPPASPVRIGPRAFLGAHVTVLKGVSIGDGSIVGAGSVVTRSIPAGQIWAGTPAKFIRNVDDPQQPHEGRQANPSSPQTLP